MTQDQKELAQIYEEMKTLVLQSDDGRYKRAKEIEKEWWDSRRAAETNVKELSDDDFYTDYVLNIQLTYEMLYDEFGFPVIVVSRVGAIETSAKLQNNPIERYIKFRNYELEVILEQRSRRGLPIVIGEFCPFNGAFSEFGSLPKWYIELAIDSYPAHIREGLRANVKLLERSRKC